MAKSASGDGGNTFSTGPFTGVWNTREPFDDTPDRLQEAVNIYIPDPQAGSAVYSRPGFTKVSSALGSGTDRAGQGVWNTGGASGGTNYLCVGGTLYSVAPTNFNVVSGVNTSYYQPISKTAKRVFFCTIGGQTIVSDGVNKPFIISTSGPIVIDWESPTVILSSNTLSIAYSSFVWSTRNANNDAQISTKTAGTVAITAGTIPADQWGVFRVYINAAGTVGMVAGAANTTTGYATNAAAIAAKPALPTPATDWDMGYFTVQTHAGNSWTAGTDALAGGGGVHPANATNYYAPVEGPPWAAYGRPTIYQSSVFFIVSQTNGTTDRQTIVWSEPNQPTVGYQQTDYDDAWTIAQTDPGQLYAIQGTNQGLFYARQASWGVVQGTPSSTFSTTATSDLVSENIGCVCPASVEVYGRYLYFLDQIGRPQRFALGGSPEALWLQLRQDYDTYQQANSEVLESTRIEQYGWATFSPTLNLYLAAPWWGLDATNDITYTPILMHAFDGTTGRYVGQWAIQSKNETTGGGVPTRIGGILRTDKGQDHVGVIGWAVAGGTSASDEGYFWWQGLGRNTTWWDVAGTGSNAAPVRWSITTPRLGYSMVTQYAWTQLRITGYASQGNGVPSQAGSASMTIVGTTSAQANVAQGTVTMAQSPSDGVRRVVAAVSNLNGRGLSLTIAQTDEAYTVNKTAQTMIFRVEADGMPSRAGVSDA